MQIEEFRKQANVLYRKQLVLQRNPSAPPWERRKSKELVYAFMHPLLSLDIVYLSSCDLADLGENQQHLVKEISNEYGISIETALTLILYAETRVEGLLSPSAMLSGIRYFSPDHEQAGWPHPDPNAYEEVIRTIANSGPDNQQELVYLQVGRSATKHDVIHFIKKNWDQHIEPLRGESWTTTPKQLKIRPNTERDLAIVALHNDGRSYNEIIDFVNGNFPDSPALPPSEIERLVKRYEPKSSALITLRSQFEQIMNRGTAPIAKPVLVASFTNENLDLQIVNN